MMALILKVLFVISITLALTESFCPKGCKCKAYGLCFDCETGYYMHNNECKSCSTNCLSCPSIKNCDKCECGYFKKISNNGNISCRPCSTGCTNCTSKQYCLDCNDGFFKDSYGCKECLPECKTCTLEGHCQTCTDGYILNGTFCIKCPEGFFEIEHSCVPCQNNYCATCSISNDCTECKQGLFGKTCDQKCSRGCVDNVCEQNTGNCTCKENYEGINCNQCIPKKYGPDCNLDCPRECITCDSNESCDVCNTGFRQLQCNCSNGCLDNDCDTWNGQCRQCKPFFKWPCVECLNGKWGKNCTNDCQNGCLSCSSEANCTQCEDGYFRSFGQCLSCPKNCFNFECNEYSGICDHGCRQGYWGIFCNETCPKNCLNRTCNKENGTCILGCKGSYHGYMCKCPNYCICNSSGQCLLRCRNPESNIDLCDKRCNSFCLNCSQHTEKCERCGNHTFNGELCDKECSNTCIDRRCDTITGRCTSGCIDGYFGDTCSKQCDSNCLTSSCIRETGLCEEEEKVDGSPTDGLSLEIGFVPLSVALAILIVAIIVSIVSFILRTKHQRHKIVSLTESVTYRQDRSSGETPACDRIVELDNLNRMQSNARQREYNQAAALGVAVPNDVEPSSQGNVYVNLEYASIERNQFLYINDECKDDIESEVYDNEAGEDFLYANTEEYRKSKVPVSQLCEFVQNKTETDYAEEFMNLPAGLIKPFNESQKEENKTKNRYKGVYPYDNRRVIVRNRKSDYINASYVDGFKMQRAYIASLGPTVKQMGADFGVFWDMVWQERVCKIVMLTNLKEQGVKKCDKYWPDKDVCCMYEDVKVKCQSEEVYPYFTVRVFSVEKIDKRILYQMHFTAWPDKSTPKDVHGMIEFWEKLTRIPKFELGPVIVHCSAGVGRTGTFIALDILAKEGVSEGTVDIFACVRNLREDRVSLIQTVEQYRFLHEALVQLLFSDTSVKALLTNNENVQEKTT